MTNVRLGIPGIGYKLYIGLLTVWVVHLSTILWLRGSICLSPLASFNQSHSIGIFKSIGRSCFRHLEPVLFLCVHVSRYDILLQVLSSPFIKLVQTIILELTHSFVTDLYFCECKNLLGHMYLGGGGEGGFR